MQYKVNVASEIHDIQAEYLKMEVGLKTLKCVLRERETNMLTFCIQKLLVANVAKKKMMHLKDTVKWVQEKKCLKNVTES